MSLVERLDRMQRRHPAAGYPLAVAYKFFDDQGNYLTAMITYYAFLSLFPLLLLLISILGFALHDDPGLQARVLDSALSRLPVIGQQIADSLEAMLQPHGVAVYLEAHHLCTQMRGVQETSPLTRTTFWRGAYEDNPALRSEFFVACGLPRERWP